MGEVFAGRYELVDPVGRGGAGAVWRAWDHRRRRYVAAKVLLQSDAHTLLRFVREQALRIDHPHVLAPASWAADDDKVLFTMDLVGGGSLGHVIGDYGPLPPRFVCALLDQLLSGLAAVHAEGVVHRDIKPANILMEATGTGRPHLRLSDFGISMRKGEPRLTETDYVVGTPGYFAPEQLMGAEPDFPADLFAVGLVALYLLQGRKPDSRALVEHFLAHGTPGAPEGVPAPLWDVIAGLLQPDPDSRFRTATGARKALAGAVELLGPPAPEEGPVEVFDQLGPLPAGFGPQGPLSTAAVTPQAPTAAVPSQTQAQAQPQVPAQPQVQPRAPYPSAHQPLRPAPLAAADPVPQSAATPTPPPAPYAHPPAVPAPASLPPAYGAPTPVPTAAGDPRGSAVTVASYQPSETGSFHLSPPAPGTAPSARAGRIAPPPTGVKAGILVAALLCFAVGVWALTRL
ncbi:serine/threonine protein kinase [Streptomyces sp. CB00455]|uniref:serine/threonine-protein kinase n=1 Tax=Streptomyces sp. CB00455 TaxID=1703927 RepID=UPI00093A9D3C|nr:serine/threonine-protein kinase [Streptomyces sp. CB00455]OKK18273.1 serine/threonine protein kinase [Streptomyces sp. CB00455]